MGRDHMENPSQNPERTPAADDQTAALEDKASASGIDDAEQEPVEWAKIMLAARVHSEASVSSPTVGYYRWVPCCWRCQLMGKQPGSNAR